MTDPLRRAFRSAAATAGALGNATQAMTIAHKRHRQRIVGGTTLGAAAVLAAVALTTQTMHTSSTPPASVATSTHQTGPTSPTTTPPRITSRLSGAIRITSPNAPSALLYRSCAAGTCEVGLVDNSNQHLAVAAPVADALAEQGLDDVTLSTDGYWIGYPHDGMFKVAAAFDESQSVDVPAGPAGSYWRPYFWSGSAHQDLVLAQWTGDRVSAFAIVHVGSVSAPDLTVVEEPTPAGVELRLIDVGAAYDNVLTVSDAMPTPEAAGREPAVQTLRPRELFFSASTLNEPGLSGTGEAVDLSGCMRSRETLIGPEGAPISFVPPGTSSDQDRATVVFRQWPTYVEPAGVIKGSCSSQDRADGIGRYDLPESTYTDYWILLAPISDSSSLMLHGTDVSRGSPGGHIFLDRDLMVVGADGEQVVGGVSMRTEVVAPGGTGGFFS